MGEICNPDVMLMQGMIGKQEVGIDIRLLLWFEPLLASPPIRLESKEVHHTQDTLLVDGEMDRESLVSIRRMFPQDFLDGHLELPVLVGEFGMIV